MSDPDEVFGDRVLLMLEASAGGDDVTVEGGMTWLDSLDRADPDGAPSRYAQFVASMATVIANAPVQSLVASRGGAGVVISEGAISAIGVTDAEQDMFDLCQEVIGLARADRIDDIGALLLATWNTETAGPVAVTMLGMAGAVYAALPDGPGGEVS